MDPDASRDQQQDSRRDSDGTTDPEKKRDEQSGPATAPQQEQSLNAPAVQITAPAEEIGTANNPDLRSDTSAAMATGPVGNTSPVGTTSPTADANTLRNAMGVTSIPTTPRSSPSHASPELPTQTGVVVVGKEVSFVATEKSGVERNHYVTKDILRTVNFCALPGEVMAIMGASGCGKTSLLNILAGRTKKLIQPPTSEAGNAMNLKACRGSPQPYGELFINGHHVDYTGVQQNSRYVMQSDCLLPFLTVEETVTFAAKLQLTHLSSQDVRRKVDEVVEKMGLVACRNVVVGDQVTKGISGGQKKRCAIAIELLSDPPLLYLDEPTSGLDSSLAFDVIKTLQKLARSGKTIVCTIHQPRSQIFAIFDKVMFLSKGKIVYQGPANQAAEYAAEIGHPIPPNFNVPDFFLDLLSAVTMGTENESRNSSRNRETLKRRQSGGLLSTSFISGGATLGISDIQDNSRGNLGLDEGQELLYELQKGQNAPSFMRETISLSEIEELPNSFQKSKWNVELNQLLERSIQQKFRLIMDVKRRKRETVGYWLKNVGTLSHRIVVNHMRDWVGTAINVAVTCVMTLITGLLYYKFKKPEDLPPGQGDICLYYFNYVGALAFSGINNSFSAVQLLMSFPDKRPMLNREIKSNLYRPSAYFVAQQIGDFPFILLYPFVHAFIIYWMVEFGTKTEHFFYYLLMVCLIAFSANSWAQIAAMASKNTTSAAALTPIGVVVAALLSGLWITEDKLRPPWNIVKYITWIRYAMNGFIKFRFDDGITDQCAPLPNNPNAAGNLACCFAIGIAFRIVAYILFRFANTRVGIET